VNNEKYHNVLMAMPTTIDATGVHYGEVTGTPEELAALDASYAHLQKMRDEIIELGIIPPVSEWKEINPNL
jgi:malate dehydrogenase